MNGPVTDVLYVLGVFVMGCTVGLTIAAAVGLMDRNERILRRRRRQYRRVARARAATDEAGVERRG